MSPNFIYTPEQNHSSLLPWTVYKSKKRPFYLELRRLKPIYILFVSKSLNYLSLYLYYMWRGRIQIRQGSNVEWANFQLVTYFQLTYDLQVVNCESFYSQLWIIEHNIKICYESSFLFVSLFLKSVKSPNPVWLLPPHGL